MDFSLNIPWTPEHLLILIDNVNSFSEAAFTLDDLNIIYANLFNGDSIQIRINDKSQRDRTIVNIRE